MVRKTRRVHEVQYHVCEPTTTLQSEQFTSLPLYCGARRCPKGFYSAIWAAGLAVGLGCTICVAVRRSLDCCVQHPTYTNTRRNVHPPLRWQIFPWCSDSITVVYGLRTRFYAGAAGRKQGLRG